MTRRKLAASRSPRARSTSSATPRASAKRRSWTAFTCCAPVCPRRKWGAQDAVRAYKGLATVERAFRASKSDLEVRPLHHHTEPRVRAHVFLCMPAYYVVWRLLRSLAPMLFQDHDRAAAEAAR